MAPALLRRHELDGNGPLTAHVAVLDTSLYVEEMGSGPPVLLVHGSGCNVHSWGSVPEQLAESSRVIAYDRRGYGRSSRAPAKDYGVHVADAEALLLKLGQRPVTVVGWSSGGVVALSLALRDREAVSGIVLMEPPLHGQLHPTLELLRLYPTLQRERLRGHSREAAQRFLRFVTSSSAGGNSFDALPEQMREEMLADADTLMSEFKPSLRPGTGENLRKRQLSSITCPIRCLVGARSNPWLTRAARRLARWHHGVELFEIAGTTHSMPLEAPGEVVRHVREMAGAAAPTA